MSGIYLAFTQSEMNEKRLLLHNTLLKAGLQVFPSNSIYSEDFFPHITEEISKADCSVHILGLEYGEQMPGKNFSMSE